MKQAVGDRAAELLVEEKEQERELHALGGGPVRLAGTIAVEQGVELRLKVRKVVCDCLKQGVEEGSGVCVLKMGRLAGLWGRLRASLTIGWAEFFGSPDGSRFLALRRVSKPSSRRSFTVLLGGRSFFGSQTSLDEYLVKRTLGVSIA